MNFDEYWAALDAELADEPAHAVLTPMPSRSTKDFSGYEVRLTSLGGYRIFGYLSVPTGPGPFPGLLELPRHGSVNNAPHYHERLRYVVFTLMHRGQRRADEPFAAAYPGLFTRGITDPATYVYRDIVADCLRGAEFLWGRPELDPGRAGLVGDDLALLTAARRRGFTAVEVTGPLLHNALRLRHSTSEYPLEELNDHLRRHPGDEERIVDTLSYFEPARHALSVTARTLITLPGGPPRHWTDELLSAFGGRMDTYRRTDEDAIDMRALDAWLAGWLGVEPMARFTA
ncbi:acetylxylan esterase [Amycolatopsis sp. NPDC058986]|uniref:acetylxylan esterase n=1 Tax=unclassified Amycolatopsis TaxID=2618356 RepID=UPI00366CB3F1